MSVADNSSSFTIGGAGVDYRTIGSLIIQETLIF